MDKIKIGDKVLIYRKISNFNNAGLMDKWIGKIMTVRKIYDSNSYRMEEDVEEGGFFIGRGWCWETECMKLVKDIVKGSNITEEEFLSKYYEELEKNPDTTLNCDFDLRESKYKKISQ